MSRDDIQSNALKTILKHDRCGVSVSMGVGKTLIGLQHMRESYSDTCKFLVVAPKKAIFQSWLDEADKHGLSHLKQHIDFSTYISLNKKDETLYDVVYLDECHSLLDTHDEFLSFYKGSIIGFTGTPPKNEESEKGQMVGEYCPIVYEYTTDDAVGDGILNDYQIIVHKMKLDDRKNYMQKTKKGQFPTSELASYNYWSERLLKAEGPKETQILRIMRMKALMGFPSKERYAKRLFDTITDKAILFANTQDQADKLCEHSYHSGNKDSEFNLVKFKSGELNKLSCVLQLSEGVNIPNLKEGIIMHSYGNERKASQRLGRLLRLNPDETAIVHILCYEDTVDETWVKQAIEKYDKSKIKIIQRNGIQQTQNY